MTTIEAVIKNKAGIHVRPTGIIIQEAKNYNCAITVAGKGMETNLDDYMGLLSLGLCMGDVIEIRVQGDEEKKAAENLKELFQKEFDFPPRA